jgi:predicted P-loop ATPase
VALYRAGEPWWLTAEQEEEVERSRQPFEASDTWQDAIANFIEFKEVAVIAEILENLFRIEPAQHDRKLQNRVRDCLYRLGWQPLASPIWRNGFKVRAWIKKEGFS